MRLALCPTEAQQPVEVDSEASSGHRPLKLAHFQGVCRRLGPGNWQGLEQRRGNHGKQSGSGGVRVP